MELRKEYNQYSEALLEFFPVLKKGQTLKFKVMGTYFDKLMNREVIPTSVSIKAYDRIYDPGHDKEIDIAYIIGTRPLGPTSARSEETLLGEITFSRGNFGLFEWDGNKAGEALAKFLFFTNSNSSNRGKPWYIDGTPQIMTLSGEQHKATLAADLLVDKAKARLIDMSSDFLVQLKLAWFPQDASDMSEAQLMLKLRAIAERDPSRILSVDLNGEVNTMASVNTFVKEGLIKVNEIETQWLFKDGTVLVGIKSDEAPYIAIKRFFSTETGQKVYLLLEEEIVKA